MLNCNFRLTYQCGLHFWFMLSMTGCLCKRFKKEIHYPYPVYTDILKSISGFAMSKFQVNPTKMEFRFGFSIESYVKRQNSSQSMTIFMAI